MLRSMSALYLLLVACVPNQLTPTPTPPPLEPFLSEGDWADCTLFETQPLAQNFFLAAGGPSRDSHNLDGDSDGVACENLPSDVIFGPLDVDLTSVKDNSYFDALATGVHTANAFVEATFVNPHSADIEGWAQGISFRESDGRGLWLLVVVRPNNQYWQLFEHHHDGSDGTIVLQGGNLDSLDRDDGGQNTIWIKAIADQVEIFINRTSIAEVGVTITQAGLVAVETHIQSPKDKIPPVRDFRVTRLT